MNWNVVSIALDLALLAFLCWLSIERRSRRSRGDREPVVWPSRSQPVTAAQVRQLQSDLDREIARSLSDSEKAQLSSDLRRLREIARAAQALVKIAGDELTGSECPFDRRAILELRIALADGDHAIKGGLPPALHQHPISEEQGSYVDAGAP